jgi:hypothetical protein
MFEADLIDGTPRGCPHGAAEERVGHGLARERGRLAAVTTRPEAVGAVLAGDLSSGSSEPYLPWVIGYTIFHLAAFLTVGLILSFVAHRAEEESSILAVFLILFVVFELGFYGLTAILAETRLPGALAWYRVAVGNLLAAGLMGAYVWRGHRALAAEFAEALGARE